jgi:molecular chaperone DnaK (HSP70)
MDRLERKLTKDLLNVTPIEFWFTMPAIWSDEAQHATRTAAMCAGFGTRSGDSVKMITEPEAAALAAFKTTKDKFDDLLVVRLAAHHGITH